MFEGPVTGNIPEVLDNGEVTDGTHVTAGQLALALTPYAQVTDLAVNTAAAGNNAAAIQSLDDRVTAELASKLDSSALAPAIAPLATAAALATTDGQAAAHGSSIAALQSSLTTGLSNKADQSAFDVLEGVVATKSTPDGVDLKLSNYSTTAAMNGSIASANNATLATVAANYGLKTVVDQHSLDIAARITPLEVDTKVANALLGAVTAAALASELASRDASISGLQASKADASALTAYALQSSVDTSSEVDSKIAAALLGAVTTAALDAALLGKADASALASLLSTVDGLDTPLEVDTKIANALLGLATEAFVAAQLASRDASITALQASKADAALLASYATNAALSASETALQSALDAILAELAALQLSGSGVVNAPAWAGFTTWELLRGSSVVRNLHFVAPLSAALANGDDTLSITADCYSVAAADAALAAALLAYYTSSQVDTLLGDYRTGTAQDAETTSAITAALLGYYTSAQVDALLGDYRTASAQDTQTQAAIAGALLAYRTGPDQDVFTTNQITSALVAYRSAADQDTATASSIAAALLGYYTIAQVDGLLAGKLGVAEAASALQIAVRFPDDGGADEVVAAIGEQILAPTDVSLSNWTVRPSSGCSVVLATHTAGVSVDGYTLTLAVNPWNIVRTYNLTPGRELLFACRYRLGTASNFVVYMSEADNVYDPLYGSFVGDQGVWSTAKMYFTVPPNGVAKLHFGAHFQAPGLPNQTAGTVDVYGLQILDATLETGNAVEEEDTAASALLLKHEFLDGGADDVTLATLGEVLLEPTLTTLGNFLVRSNSQSSVASASFTVGGFQLEGYAMTLSAFAWNIVRTYTLTPGRRYSFGCRYRLGTASNLVMYVSAADNDYVGVTGTFLGTPSQGVWSTARLDFSVPPGGIAKLHFGAFGGSIPGLVQQSAGTLDLYSMQIRASAFEGESVSVTDLLADSLALTGSATLDGLTAQGNVGCDQLLCNDVNCTDVFTTGVDASGAVSCAALTATGAVAGATLSSTGAVSGSSLSISGAASVGVLSSATGITGSTLTINNTANAGNFTTVGDVSTGTLTASGAATAASFAATGALTGATLTITGAASTGPLDCESLDCTFTATSGGVSTGSVVCGDVTSSGTVSAPQLFASNTLTVTNTSDFSDDLFLTKNWAGWSKLQVSNNSAASDSGPELRLLGNQSARVFLERDGGAHQCELIMINDEALVQTKSLSTQLSLTTNQRNPGCLVIAGNTGNVVCNTSFTNLSDSRVKTEMAEADVAELQQLFDSVEAKQYKRPDMNGDLRLGFASNDFAGTKWKNLTGTARWSDGTEMVTLDYSHLTSVLWGVCKGFQARLDEVEAWQAQWGPKNE